jgi:hypothetical protein
MDNVRKDRSGGGRKWHTLASALHRETEAYVMIPTETSPEKVKRRHAVLRPRHLPTSLVSNSLLKEVSGGDKSFAHQDAVEAMDLEKCVDACPVSLVLDCIRVKLTPSKPEQSESAADDRELWPEDEDEENDSSFGSKKKGKRPKKKKGSPKRVNKKTSGSPSLSNEMLLGVWTYLAGEYASCQKRGGQEGKESLRFLLEALIGSTSTPSSAPPFRVFPVRGCSSSLRLLCEHGAPLCHGIAPSLKGQGASVIRLVGNVVPFLNMDRLQGVDGFADLIKFIGVAEASETDLQQQLKIHFRFGLATTVNPQLWWDSYRYTISLGYEHGLVEFLGGRAVALPVVASGFGHAISCSDDGDGGGGGSGGGDGGDGDGRDGFEMDAPSKPCKVVSSRDVHKLSVAMPCLFGLKRDPTKSKYSLAIPPSVSSWGARVRWELAMVEVLGVEFPAAATERIPGRGFAAELLLAVADAREQGDTSTLHALASLLIIYERKIGAFFQKLQNAISDPGFHSHECLLESQNDSFSTTSSCSPKFIDELMRWAKIKIGHPSFHATRSFLESGLGMLRLTALDATTFELAEENSGELTQSTAEEDIPTHEEEQAFWDLVNKVGDPESREVCEEFERSGDKISFQASQKLLVHMFISSKLLKERVKEKGDGGEGSNDDGSDDDAEENDSAEEEEEERDDDDDDNDDNSRGDDEGSTKGDTCDDATWDVLDLLLGFQHTFDPSQSASLLYSSLAASLFDQSSNVGGGGGATAEYEEEGDDEFVDAEGGSASEGENEAVVSSTKKNMLNVSQMKHISPLIKRLSVHSLLQTSSSTLWPLISKAAGIWLGVNFMPLERCVWDEDDTLWSLLEKVGCEAGSVVAVDREYESIFEEEEGIGILQSKKAFAALNELGHCFLFGSGRHPSLPYPKLLDMMLESTIPWLLNRDLSDRPFREQLQQPQWSEKLLACYAAVVTATFPLAQNERWKIQVASAQLVFSAQLGVLNIVVDRRLNPLLAREAANMVVLPDAVRFPHSNSFVLAHFRKDCLHPALAPIFSPLAERQSVGLQSPAVKIRTDFKRCLRLMVKDALSSPFGSEEATDEVISWGLISELYERSSFSQEQEVGAVAGARPIPNGFTDKNNWELLLLAAILCAKQWHRMK